jgi:hypothetical protein
LVSKRLPALGTEACQHALILALTQAWRPVPPG